MSGGDFFETKCPVCGKEICMLFPDRWSYVFTNGGTGSKKYYCCSWSCFCAGRSINRGRGSRANAKERIFELIKEGKNDREIMSIANVTIGTVRYWKDRYTE